MITEARKIARRKAQELSVKSKPKTKFSQLPPNKCWGKAGHAMHNLITQSRVNAQKFEDDLNYAL